MTDNIEDPRHRGFASFQVGSGNVTPARRGIAAPPPKKPEAITTPATERNGDDLGDRRLTARPVRQLGFPNQEDPEQRILGTPRHRMRYIQFQVSSSLSDLLSKRAAEEDVVLGEVVMEAVRSFNVPKPEVVLRRRRRSAMVPVRRQVLVRVTEAEEVQTLAEQFRLTPSALIRSALEEYLS